MDGIYEIELTNIFLEIVLLVIKKFRRCSKQVTL